MMVRDAQIPSKWGVRHLKVAQRWAIVALVAVASHAFAALPDGRPAPDDVLKNWYGLILKLVRHTPTYSPPVASRAFGYLGVTAYEAVASGSPVLVSLAGQLHELTQLPKREAGKTYDESIVLEAAMARAAMLFFDHTGPTGQRALAGLSSKLQGDTAAGISPDIIERSQNFGESIADHIALWAKSDGGDVIETMGFPADYALTPGPSHWVPTNAIRMQQTPLLPAWGNNRTFIIPDGASCPLPPPPDYSEDPNSTFYKQAFEVYTTSKNLTPEQRKIARFWTDDPMLSPTPPGHWNSMVLQIMERQHAPIETYVDVLARLGIAVADGFIGCWHEKFRYDLVRPVTYIRRLIDPTWESPILTPPFPEYPSGHSTQSASAASVLTPIFGENFAFDDATGEADGLQPRHFSSFWEAANEAGISRLYGGIHFRAAIEQGLEQGRCIGRYVNALKTRK